MKPEMSKVASVSEVNSTNAKKKLKVENFHEKLLKSHRLFSLTFHISACFPNVSNRECCRLEDKCLLIYFQTLFDKLLT